jgi:hypothetical protein
MNEESERVESVPFVVDGVTYELPGEWATLVAENLQQHRVLYDNEQDAESDVAAAHKIEDFLVGRTSAPVNLTIDEGLPVAKNLDVILLGAIKTEDEAAEAQIRALYGALDARLEQHLRERYGPRGPGR